MKGENISGDTAIGLGLKTMFNLDVMLNGGVNRDDEDVFKTVTDQYTVDTCEAFDTQTWETGIKDSRYHGGSWIIVSQYRDRAAAIKGQEGWVREMEDGPPASLYDVFSEETFEIDGGY